MYGYDDTHAYLVDTEQQGTKVKTTLQNLALARSEKGPMSSRNLSFTIEKTDELPELNEVIKKAIVNNATDYLNPPIKNLGYKGIIKTIGEVKKWFGRSTNIAGEFRTAALLMERAGTGGALFRNLYRDFLLEAYQLLGIKELQTGFIEFKKHAELWTELSNLFIKIADTADHKYLADIGRILTAISNGEKESMEKLMAINLD